MIGVGAMIQELSGSGREKAAEAFTAIVGKTVKSAVLDKDDGDGALFLEFEGLDKKVKLYDDGRSCCESRYMTCDDDLSNLVGGQLVNIEVADGPSAEGEYGDSHDQQFLKVSTTKGSITVATHNEHNGYYGGFYLKAELV